MTVQRFALALVSAMAILASKHPATAAAPEELADFIAEALPSDGFNNVAWDYMSSSPRIEWITDGVAIGNQESERVGIMRLRVAGQTSQILQQHWQELPWSVKLQTLGPMKFGVKLITIAPGNYGSGDTVCFGTNTKGCEFIPAAALKSNKLHSERLCDYQTGSESKAAYSVSAAGKKPSLVVVQTSGGSGGTSSWVEIRPLSDKAEVCKPS